MLNMKKNYAYKISIIQVQRQETKSAHHRGVSIATGNVQTRFSQLQKKPKKGHF